jgi:hypothetical protein
LWITYSESVYLMYVYLANRTEFVRSCELHEFLMKHQQDFKSMHIVDTTSSARFSKIVCATLDEILCSTADECAVSYRSSRCDTSTEILIALGTPQDRTSRWKIQIRRYASKTVSLDECFQQLLLTVYNRPTSGIWDIRLEEVSLVEKYRVKLTENRNVRSPSNSLVPHSNSLVPHSNSLGVETDHWTVCRIANFARKAYIAEMIQVLTLDPVLWNWPVRIPASVGSVNKLNPKPKHLRLYHLENSTWVLYDAL